jgi:hypothetical protein
MKHNGEIKQLFWMSLFSLFFLSLPVFSFFSYLFGDFYDTFGGHQGNPTDVLILGFCSGLFYFFIVMRLYKVKKSSFKSILIPFVLIVAAFCVIFRSDIADSFKSRDALIEELHGSDPVIQLKAFYKLYKTGNLDMRRPEKIDWLVDACIKVLEEDGSWTSHYAEKYYLTVRDVVENRLVVDSLVRHMFAPKTRLRTLVLSIKLGIPGSIESLSSVLFQHGDKQMAEDFLNSGSTELQKSGEKWASTHGYFIGSGRGSHRGVWGHF